MSPAATPATALACSTNLTPNAPTMKTLLLFLALLAGAVGYNALLVTKGPSLYKAINGPEPVKAKTHRNR